MAVVHNIWGTTCVPWNKACWKWSQCTRVIGEIAVQPDGVDATTLIQPWLIEPWNPYRAGEKKKKLIRLICKVKGMEYDESKEMKDFKLSIDDIKLVMGQIEIDLNVKKLEE